MMDEWKRVDTLADAFGERFGDPPDAVVVLGSGLGQVAESLNDKTTAAVTNLPDYPVSTVSGHAGRIHQGILIALHDEQRQGDPPSFSGDALHGAQ